MHRDHLDHLVLTVRDVDATIAFYARVLGMQAVTFGAGRRALAFGNQKIDLRPASAPLEPRPLEPTPGSGDLCFITSTPLAEVVAHRRVQGVAVEVGPVQRPGATGPILSVYFRDPDGDLAEVAKRTG